MPWDKIDAPIHFGIKQPILIGFQIVKRIAHNDQFKLIEDKNGLTVEVRKIRIV
jgi:hypothetical protein